MEKSFLNSLLDKLTIKMKAECGRNGSMIPYIPKNGRYTDISEAQGLSWWTNGFWAGIMWQMYSLTGENCYREAAEGVEQRLDAELKNFINLHHDVGFMWLHTSVANYRLTENENSLRRGLHAANLLAGRYNPGGRFIRAWNGERAGWTIVDTMMNLPLLYWASRETGDPRFAQIAKHHADTCMNVTVRPDGSCNHIVILNPENGEIIENPAGQGYESGSAWSRGNAWAVYGFALSYRHTGEQRYLDTAKRAAHYFALNLAVSDWLPLVDFRAPEEPLRYDSTAAMIAACGLLEIAEHVPEFEKNLYKDSAVKTLVACEKRFCDWNPETDAALGGGTTAYHTEWGGDNSGVPIIYGDYFLTEAIMRLCGKDFLIW